MAQPLQAGDPVKDFALPALDGNVCDSAEARRNGLLLYAFWKRTCGTCQYTFKYLQRFEDNYDGSGFRIWGIAQENNEDARDFARQYGASFTQLLDTDLSVTEEYDLAGVPALYLVDGTDRILDSVEGFDAERLNAIARVIGERTGKAYVPVVRPEDEAPDYKPG